jgi:hypothetical protein
MSFKRKTTKKLFINSFIIKNRKRLQNMNEHERRIDDAKKIDFVNEIYYIRKLKTIKNWIDVDVKKKKNLKIKSSSIDRLFDKLRIIMFSNESYFVSRVNEIYYWCYTLILFLCIKSRKKYITQFSKRNTTFKM